MEWTIHYEYSWNYIANIYERIVISLVSEFTKDDKNIISEYAVLSNTQDLIFFK